MWAWLRRDLAIKEQADHAVGKVLTAQQFRQRAALLLKQYGEKKPGSDHSRLGKLVRGMPKRLQKCKERRTDAAASERHASANAHCNYVAYRFP